MLEYINIDASSNISLSIDTNSDAAIHTLYNEFAFFVPNARWSKAYKRKKWDGYIRLYDQRSNTLPRGLLPEALTTLYNKHKQLRINVVGYDKPKNYTEAFNAWYSVIVKQLPFTPDDFQKEAALEIINGRRRIVESPTSSGKTLILFLAISFLLDSNVLEHILVIVPRIQLVKQMINDFVDEFGFDANDIQELRGGAKYNEPVGVNVTSWQSVYTEEPAYFEAFDGFFVDECHEAEAKSITGISNMLANAKYRIGVTGSLRDSRVSELSLKGTFGKIITATTLRDLWEMGRIADATVCITTFNYEDWRQKHPRLFDDKLDYHGEMKLLQAMKFRDRAIFEILDRHPDENMLIMFKLVKHGRRMYEAYKALHPDKSIYFIDGSIGVDDRVAYAKAMDSGERGIVLFASMGTTSTGISIKNIDVGVIAWPNKAKTKLLQMLGRYLRVSDSKQKALIYDIADDLQLGGSHSYAYAHAESRLNRYIEEGYEVDEEVIRV